MLWAASGSIQLSQCIFASSGRIQVAPPYVRMHVTQRIRAFAYKLAGVSMYYECRV